MVTMYSDRSLTSTGQELLRLLKPAPATTEQVAKHVSYPIYRVRVSLEELQDAKLVSVKEGIYQLTEAGSKRLAEVE